ncbi:outer membrane protein [Bartonella vinsonii]|uniref:Opacity protein and related surface antigens n=1 Tax=Bartonella vinsonii TaxID=33047 RepID=A0A3S4YTN3_BARVI|nr:outer membrane protein [Bartonella vinsonii]VEJ44391.1 Opacity protein and related surface antigens [Bartonella vinsonii]
MKTKILTTISIFTLMATSAVQAADTVVLQQPEPRVSPTLVAPPFSWTGLYLGGHISGFSSKNSLNYSQDATTGKWAWVEKSLSPKPSGFGAGLYAGSNIDLGDNFIFGVDTDLTWSGKKNTQTGDEEEISDDDALDSINAVLKEAGLPINRPGADDETIPNVGDIVQSSVTLKEQWSGATRVRIGFASNRVMPYIAAGIAYGKMQYSMSILSKSEEDPSFIFASGKVFDETQTMIGYTVGGGLDFAMTDNLIMRAEYRYSDFAKKKFADDKLEISSKINNFRVGLAYKF